MFAVYVGRGEDRALLPGVKARFLAMRRRYEKGEGGERAS